MPPPTIITSADVGRGRGGDVDDGREDKVGRICLESARRER